MDIEDLGKISLDINQGNKDDIILKREFNDEICETNLSNGIPISKKIFIKTWGCSHNNSDGEYIEIPIFLTAPLSFILFNSLYKSLYFFISKGR